MSLRCKVGGGPGIFGTEMCQVCGKFKEYFGQSSAMGTHGIFGYVCLDCYSECKKDIEPKNENERDSIRFAHQCVVRFIRKRRHALCDICGIRVSLLERRKIKRNKYRTIKRYLCEKCYSDVKNGKEKKHSSRLKYFESMGIERLKNEEVRLVAEKHHIDQMSEGVPEDKIQEDWDRRIKPEIERLSRLHGIDYAKQIREERGN